MREGGKLFEAAAYNGIDHSIIETTDGINGFLNAAQFQIYSTQNENKKKEEEKKKEDEKKKNPPRA